MSLPLAHETWFVDEPQYLDWTFLGEPATLALLGGAVLLALLVRVANHYRDGFDVGLARSDRPLRPVCDPAASRRLARRTAFPRLLPVAGDGPRDRCRRDRPGRGHGAGGDRHGHWLPHAPGSLAADRGRTLGCWSSASTRCCSASMSSGSAPSCSSPGPAVGPPTSSGTPPATGSGPTGASIVAASKPWLWRFLLSGSPPEFVRVAGAVEVLFGLLLISGALPQAIVLIAGVPFNATLWFFGINELVGHLSIYGAMLAILVFGSHPQLRATVYGWGRPARGGGWSSVERSPPTAPT